MEPQISAGTLTIIAMGTVFAILWGLALLIRLLKVALSAGEGKKTAQAPVVAAEAAEVVDGQEAGAGAPSPAVLAAISAALAAYLDQGMGNLRLSALRRIENRETWASAGRLENVVKSGSLQIRRSS